MRVRIVSPAGNIPNRIIQKGIETIESWGWIVETANHATSIYGRYAGKPEERAKNLIDAITDKTVDIIWCARGGYGCIHLIDYLPINIIKENPKWLIGYSDITVLHALWSKAGIPSLHAPMLKHLGENPLHPSTLYIKDFLTQTPYPTFDNYQSNSLMQADENYSFSLSFPSHPLNIDGEVIGKLVGGNLAVISALHGTFLDFDYTNRILFIEDIAESPYKIDRMLQSLKYSGILRQIKGLIVGQFSDCIEDPLMNASIYENIYNLMSNYNIPVIFNVPIGHVTENYPFIEQGLYRISSQKGITQILSLTK